MLVYCDMYHEEIRLLGHEEGPEKVIRRLCPECRQRMEKIVDDYVERLTRRNDKADELAISCR
jgi:hypothetical protein